MNHIYETVLCPLRSAIILKGCPESCVICHGDNFIVVHDDEHCDCDEFDDVGLYSYDGCEA